MEQLCTETIDTPIGPMQAVASAQGLCALEFLTPARQRLLQTRLIRWYPGLRLERGIHPIIMEARRWLHAYFRGRFDELTDLTLDLRGTPFELQVWKELRHISLGYTTSYSALTEGEPGRDPEYGAGDPTDPWLDSVDTRPLD